MVLVVVVVVVRKTACDGHPTPLTHPSQPHPSHPPLSTPPLSPTPLTPLTPLNPTPLTHPTHPTHPSQPHPSHPPLSPHPLPHTQPTPLPTPPPSLGRRAANFLMGRGFQANDAQGQQRAADMRRLDTVRAVRGYVDVEEGGLPYDVERGQVRGCRGM